VLRRNSYPNVQENKWRYSQTAKGRETFRRYQQSSMGHETKRRYRQSPTGHETSRCYSARRRELYIEKVEAAYNASPTVANWNRLQNLIARRMRDGR
jgi:hypothetical protein